MKTINFELSKRLNDLGLLDNIETEYGYFGYINRENPVVGRYVNEEANNMFKYKTLILEEAIEFLPIFINKFNCTKSFRIWNGLRVVSYGYEKDLINSPKGETLLEAIEKMIEYLLDNNLLTK